MLPQESENIQRKFWKYKGKIRIQDISVFGPKQNFVGYLSCLATFLRSLRFFWHQYRHTYIWCMSEQHTCHILFMTYMRRWHLSFGMHIYFNMGIKRSVKNSGMQQKCILKIVFIVKNLNILFPDFFLCIFQNFLCIFEVLGGGSKT